MTAAAARAAHLVVDQPPHIFSDTAAAAMLGDLAAELVRYHEEHPAHPVLATARGQVLCRSRYAEDRLAAAVSAGVRQYVLLGAGPGAFAYRPGLASTIATWGGGPPPTPAWNATRLSGAQPRTRPPLTFLPR